jgi:hypothetical protein
VIHGLQIQLLATLSKAGLGTLEELAEGQDVTPQQVRMVSARAYGPHGQAQQILKKYRRDVAGGDEGEVDAPN